MLQAISIRKGDCKVLQTKTVIEFLLIAEVLQFCLILHLNLDLLRLIDVLEANIVPRNIREFYYLLGQIDFGDATVLFQELSEDK